MLHIYEEDVAIHMFEGHQLAGRNFKIIVVPCIRHSLERIGSFFKCKKISLSLLTIHELEGQTLHTIVP